MGPVFPVKHESFFDGLSGAHTSGMPPMTCSAEHATGPSPAAFAVDRHITRLEMAACVCGALIVRTDRVAPERHNRRSPRLTPWEDRHEPRRSAIPGPSPRRDGPVKVGFDATPLLGPRTGIGTYTERLIDALVRVGPPDLDLVATPFSRRGTDPLVEQLPPSVGVAGRRLPARLLRHLWTRTAWPPVEMLSGPIDVFHGTNFVAPPTRHARLVVTVHDLAYLHLPEAVDAASLAYRELVPAALSRGATVCAVSETMRGAIVEAYALPAERVYVTPLGVDESWYAARRLEASDRLALPKEFVVAVGTLEPRKNLRVLLDAYRLASARRADVPPLVLVGAQGWGEALDTSGLPEPLLVRTGHLPLPLLQQVVASAALLAFPSRYEGFGLPPLEALAAGTPVIAADLAVTREVLGDQARFADPNSADAVLEGLLRSLVSPAGTRDSRRERARTFTWERCAEATLHAYRVAA